MGPFSFIVGCHFSLDVGGFSPEDPDPLLLPPRITWTTVRETVEVDHDLDGRAMLDAAGSLQTGPRTISYKHLRIVKNFPYYDILLSAQFECSVNAAAVSLSGITVEAEHMYCTVIEPAIQDYAPSAAFLPIVFEWDVMGKDVLGRYPFQTRLLNAGRNGWFTNPDTGNATPGRFVNGRGDSLELDVRMGASGLPLSRPYANDAIQVGNGANGNFYPPVANPTPPSPYATEFYKANGTKQASATAETDAVFFIWKNAHVRDFGPLLSMF
jgi:hypothetical protein